MSDTEKQVNPRLLTYQQAADYLSLSYSTIRNLVRKGILDVIRIGDSVRIDIRDLDKLIEQTRTRDVEGSP
ncbi:MAG TPA: helix-turn-helix domain-containing protein [Caldisericia bacterium]|nr:helix-turn-helix domain-containing protein [Caldisericia bacterium]HPF49834.1 helix-turn-helix domain-containing protein [Caldisericia bacterium]